LLRTALQGEANVGTGTLVSMQPSFLDVEQR